MRNLKVLVLEGGFNEEHEVSLSTGKEVKKSLINLGIEYDSLIVKPKNFTNDIKNFDKNYICFNALHGPFGEDGTIQQILDELGFKYTHSDSKSSYIGFDKDLTKKKLTETSILYPKYYNLNFQDLNEHKLNELLLKFGQFIIKPNCSGSSFGIKIFRNQNDINIFVKDFENKIKIYENHNNILVEEFLNGRELTVSVIEKNGLSVPIEVTEIISYNDNYFDYKSKYVPGASKHILPADLKKSLYDECKKNAKIAHDKIKCRGISRSDFILVKEDIFFLEINTQPGLTQVSLLPEQVKYQNISFDNLIFNIIKCSS